MTTATATRPMSDQDWTRQDAEYAAACAEEFDQAAWLEAEYARESAINLAANRAAEASRLAYQASIDPRVGPAAAQAAADAAAAAYRAALAIRDEPTAAELAATPAARAERDAPEPSVRMGGPR